MSKASRVARVGRLSRTVRRVRAAVLPFAVHTGDRAYQFHQFSDGSVIEVRVWPDGRTCVTDVSAGR